MGNPVRGWVRLTIRALPKKSWHDDLKKMKSMVVALVTMIFITLTILNGYYFLNAVLPALKDALGISFLVIILVMYCLFWERIIRVAKYNARMRDNNSETRR